jgi:hypothetical protein
MGSTESTIPPTAGILGYLLSLFRANPDNTNDTDAAIEEHIRAACEAQKAQRKRAKEARNREADATRKAEEAEKQAHKDREQAVEAKRQAQAASERAGEILKAAEKQNGVLMSQLEQAQTYLSKGIQPVVWPTEEEFNNAKECVQYRSDCIHFAVCGSPGTGKSSLINAVRGLDDHDDGAAPTGVVETTVSIQRYPDTRKEDPFPRFAWFDVPGGGSAKIGDWQYFNEQGLFIFDVILVVYNDVSPSASQQYRGTK